MIKINKYFLFIVALLPMLDQFLAKNFESYGLGLFVRISTHLAIPLVWYLMIKKNFKKSLVLYKEPFLIKTQKDKQNTIKLSLIGSSSAIIVITGLFFALSHLIDFNNIRDNVSLLYELTIPYYIMIGLLISFFNPLIEEYFWRGYIYKELDKKFPDNIALLSGILFSFHHAVMLFSWFKPIILLIVVIGLSIVGVLFNWMYKKTGSIYATLITHIAADITIIIIGYFILFT